MANATQDPPLSAASVDSTASPETSFGSAPVCSITPIGTVTTPARERSGTVIVRPRWDSTLAPPMRRAEASGSTSTDDSQPETETEDDEDVNIDRDRAHTSPECLGNPPQTSPHTRRAAGIITGSPPTTTTRVSLEVDAGAHTIINNRLTASMKLESRTASFPSNPTMTLPWVPLLVLQALSRVSDPHRFRTSRTACRQGAQHERHPEGPPSSTPRLLQQIPPRLARRDRLLCHDLLPALNVLMAACGPHTSDLNEYTSTRESLFYPPSLPLSAALEITDRLIPNAVRTINDANEEGEVAKGLRLTMQSRRLRISGRIAVGHTLPSGSGHPCAGVWFSRP